MHFIVALILPVGFALVLSWGLLQVIWDLSQMSFHAPPELLPLPKGRIVEVDSGDADDAVLQNSPRLSAREQQ